MQSGWCPLAVPRCYEPPLPPPTTLQASEILAGRLARRQIAGIFGMNLDPGYEQSDGWFWSITVRIRLALCSRLRYRGCFVPHSLSSRGEEQHGQHILVGPFGG